MVTPCIALLRLLSHSCVVYVTLICICLWFPAGALAKISKLCQPGAKVVDICEQGDLHVAE